MRRLPLDDLCPRTVGLSTDVRPHQVRGALDEPEEQRRQQNRERVEREAPFDADHEDAGEEREEQHGRHDARPEERLLASLCQRRPFSDLLDAPDPAVG
jgi:hypothetical protein